MFIASAATKPDPFEMEITVRLTQKALFIDPGLKKVEIELISESTLRVLCNISQKRIFHGLH